MQLTAEIQKKIQAHYKNEYIDKALKEATGVSGFLARLNDSIGTRGILDYSPGVKTSVAGYGISVVLFLAFGPIVGGASTLLTTGYALSEAAFNVVEKRANKALKTDVRNGVLVKRYVEEVLPQLETTLQANKTNEIANIENKYANELNALVSLRTRFEAAGVTVTPANTNVTVSVDNTLPKATA